ncbi:hypothetical protein K435DRAFT_440203 [Dendrothele bispora CBS 962.96]|uniref:Uncharacterized protein n=1 Tax=Dendrothele bispora (strain CBS 962.96) TaxID=1314807 RepID=A0A4S8MDG6_DENBC|nr:hypothetical protein K435DRAFT_440203 [Dendrothele bispora CBS 962.96]
MSFYHKLMWSLPSDFAFLSTVLASTLARLLLPYDDFKTSFPSLTCILASCHIGPTLPYVCGGRKFS